MPVVFVASMVVPHQGELPLGIHEALGCSGSGSGVPGPGGSVAPPEPSWFSMTAADAREPGATLRVGTDGFVVLTGSSYGLTAEQALAGIKFIVTDDASEEVPGTVAPLGEGISNFGWTASKPLSVGARLTASLTATPAMNPASATSTYTLEVVGAPAELPNPAAKYANWGASYKGTGDMVDCPTAGTYRGGCSPEFVIQVPSSFEADGGYVDLSFDGTPTSGVAWEVTIAQSAAHADSTLFYAQTAFVTGPNTTFFELGRVGFGVGAAEACALVTVKDLRTGKEVSAEVCSDKQPATTISANSMLGECTQPPNEAVRDLWCQMRLGVGKTCDGTTLPLDDMPNEDQAKDPGTPNEATAANDANTPAGAHDSSSCQFGHSSSSGAWLLSGVGLAFAALRRRRTHQ